MKRIGSTVGILGDVLDLSRVAWYAFRGAALSAILPIVSAVHELVRGVAWAASYIGVDLSGAVEATGTVVQGLRDQIQSDFAAAAESMGDFASGKSRRQMEEAFNGIASQATEAATAIAELRKRQREGQALFEAMAAEMKVAEDQAKKVADVIGKIENQYATFGLGEIDKQLFDLQALGATNEQLAFARDLLEQMNQQTEAQNLAKSLEAEAARVIEATRTPLEQYETQIGKLSDLLAAGLIDWDTYGRAVRDAREQLEGTAKAAERMNAAGITDAVGAVALAANDAMITTTSTATTPAVEAADRVGVAVNQAIAPTLDRQTATLDDILRELTRLGARVSVGGAA